MTKRLVKVISIVLVITFVYQDIVCACPVGSALAPKSEISGLAPKSEISGLAPDSRNSGWQEEFLAACHERAARGLLTDTDRTRIRKVLASVTDPEVKRIIEEIFGVGTTEQAHDAAIPFDADKMFNFGFFFGVGISVVCIGFLLSGYFFGIGISSYYIYYVLFAGIVSCINVIFLETSVRKTRQEKKPGFYGLIQPFYKSAVSRYSLYISYIYKGRLFSIHKRLSRLHPYKQFLIYIHEAIHLLTGIEAGFMAEFICNLAVFMFELSIYAMPLVFVVFLTNISAGWGVLTAAGISILLKKIVKKIISYTAKGGLAGFQKDFRKQMKNIQDLFVKEEYNTALAETDRLIEEMKSCLAAYLEHYIKSFKGMDGYMPVLYNEIYYDSYMTNQKNQEFFKAIAKLYGSNFFRPQVYYIWLLCIFHDLAVYLKNESSFSGQEDVEKFYKLFLKPYRYDLSGPAFIFGVFKQQEKPFSPALFMSMIAKLISNIFGKNIAGKIVFWRVIRILAKSIFYIVSLPKLFITVSVDFILEKRKYFEGKKLFSGIVISSIKKDNAVSDDAIRFITSADLLEDDAEGEPRSFMAMLSLIMIMKSGYPVPIEEDEEGLLKRGADSVNIGIYGLLSEDDLSVLEEGSRRKDANFVMLLGKPSVRFIKQGGKRLACARYGIMFKDGKMVFVRFKSPLVLHYILNYRPDLTAEIKKTKIPVPGHTMVDDYTEEKDITTMILDERRIAVPKTIAVIAKNDKHKSFIERRQRSSSVRFVKADDGELEKKIRDILLQFLDENMIDEAVIKPNRGHGGAGVIFYTRQNLEEAVRDVVMSVRTEQNLVIQERIVPPLISEDGVLKDWNLRVFISRNEAGEAVVGDMVVRIDKSGGPVNISKGAGVITFEELAERLGLSVEETGTLKHDVEEISLRSYLAVEEAMRQDGVLKDLKYATDFMGADVIVARENGRLIPYILEVNDHHSGGMWDLDNHLRQTARNGGRVQEGRIGRSIRDFAGTIVARAREYKDAIGLSETVKSFVSTSHMEGLKLKNGGAGAWAKNVNKRKRAIEGQADGEKIVYNIDGKKVQVSAELKKAMDDNEVDYSWLEAYLTEMFSDPKTRPERDKIYIDLLDESEYLFEDHKENGYIGVNRQLFVIASEAKQSLGDDEIARDDRTLLVIKLLKLGLRHELRHEAGEKDDKKLSAEDVKYAAMFGINYTDLLNTGIFDVNNNMFIGKKKDPAAVHDGMDDVRRGLEDYFVRKEGRRDSPGGLDRFRDITSEIKSISDLRPGDILRSRSGTIRLVIMIEKGRRIVTITHKDNKMSLGALSNSGLLEALERRIIRIYRENKKEQTRHQEYLTSSQGILLSSQGDNSSGVQVGPGRLGTIFRLPDDQETESKGLLMSRAGAVPERKPVPVKGIGYPKFVAHGDVHGELDAFKDNLLKAGVIDEFFNWIGGNSILLQAGDVIDKGPKSRETYDFLVRLQGSARIMGGEVVRLLGNHELMLLQGDFRYANFGNRSQLREIIKQDVLSGNVKAAYVFGGRIITHGGLRSKIRDAIKREAAQIKNIGVNEVTVEDIAERLNQLLVEAVKGNNYRHIIFQVDRKRGGTADVAGPFWNDISNLMESGHAGDEPQMVAHSPAYQRGKVDYSPSLNIINLDAGLFVGYGGNQSFLVIENNEMRIISKVDGEWEEEILGKFVEEETETEDEGRTAAVPPLIQEIPANPHKSISPEKGQNKRRETLIGKVLKAEFEGDIWVEAGSYVYRIWAETMRCIAAFKLQPFDKTRKNPAGSARSIYLNELNVIGNCPSLSKGMIWISDSELSREHFSVKISRDRNGVFSFEIKDHNKKAGTIVDWTSPNTDLAHADWMRVPYKKNYAREGLWNTGGEKVQVKRITRESRKFLDANDGDRVRIEGMDFVVVKIGGRTFAVEEKEGIVNIMKGVLQEALKQSDLQKLSPEKVFVIGSVYKSPRMFENHKKDRFIGINEAFFKLWNEQPENRDKLKILLQIGLEHELRHEIRGKVKNVERIFLRRDVMRLVELTEDVNGMIDFLESNRIIYDKDDFGIVSRIHGIKRLKTKELMRVIFHLSEKVSDDEVYQYCVRINRPLLNIIVEYMEEDDIMRTLFYAHERCEIFLRRNGYKKNKAHMKALELEEMVLNYELEKRLGRDADIDSVLYVYHLGRMLSMNETNDMKGLCEYIETENLLDQQITIDRIIQALDILYNLGIDFGVQFPVEMVYTVLLYSFLRDMELCFYLVSGWRRIYPDERVDIKILLEAGACKKGRVHKYYEIDELIKNCRLKAIAGECGIEDPEDLRRILRRLDYLRETERLKYILLKLMKGDGVITEEEISLLVAYIYSVMKVIDKLISGGFIKKENKREAVKRIALYLTIRCLERQKLSERLPKCMQDLGAHLGQEYMQEIIDVFGKDIRLADIYLRQIQERFKDDKEILNSARKVRKYLYLRTRISQRFDSDIKEAEAFERTDNITNLLSDFMRRKEKRDKVADILTRYLLKDRTLALKDLDDTGEGIKRITAGKQLDKLKSERVRDNSLDWFRRGIEETAGCAAVPEGTVFLQDISLYIGSGGRWDLENMSGAVLKIIKYLLENKQFAVAYEDEAKLDGFKTLLSRKLKISRKELESKLIVVDISGLDDYGAVKARLGAGKKIVSAVKGENKCFTAKGLEDKIIKSGKGDITDLYLMWHVAISIGRLGEGDLNIKSLSTELKPFLKEYYKGSEMALEIDEVIKNMLKEGLHILLPPVAPFVKEYYDTLNRSELFVERSA